MDLPAELRNLVYAEVAKDNIAVLEKGTFTDNSAFSQVSAQIHNEYMPILALHAKAIKPTVVDFDFRHIVTFINRLSAAELNNLPSLTKSNGRNIEITLHFTNRAPFPDDYLLRRWLKRAGSTTKKGTMLDFQYSVFSPAKNTARWVTHQYRGLYFHNSWLRMLDRCIQPSKGVRSMEEAEKIRKALLKL